MGVGLCVLFVDVRCATFVVRCVLRVVLLVGGCGVLCVWCLLFVTCCCVAGVVCFVLGVGWCLLFVV